MNEPQKNIEDYIQEQARAIVAEGREVRARIARLVTETVEKFHLERQGLIGLARSVLEGTQAAVDRAVGHDADSVLYQVVDGLGDGFSATALACRLAFEEARAQGKSFASEDLAKLRGDLKALADLFVETVSTTTSKFRSLAADQVRSVRAHADRTRARVLPALESALAAARQHSLELAGASVATGLAESRQALGDLFSVVGRRLQEAGQRMTGKTGTS